MSNSECFKIDMGCECYPPAPDKPLPFLFPLYGASKPATIYAGFFYTHPSNPGKVGVGNGISIPNYSNYTFGLNFGQTLPIVIDPPSGFPGPGLVQATATMTINSVGDVTVTMTNNGAGYNIGATIMTGVNHTYSNRFQIINVKYSAATDLGQPVGLLALPLPFRPNLTLASAKVIPQLCGYIENIISGGAITANCKWYKNGVQIGNTLSKVITVEGRHKIVHYCPATTFLSTDKLSYQITSTSTDLVNFTGDIIYYIQYI